MKKLAARDWEDMLQVAIPVFEGLLEEPYNTIILDLLFTLATWHGLAKLRLHTESTLKVFEECTRNLGTILRRFSASVCSQFATKELPREEAARGRRTAAKLTQSMGKKGKGRAHANQPPSEGSTPSGPKLKMFSLSTYKLHALGDYPKMIWTFGTTDSYSTQTVSSASCCCSGLSG